MEWKPKTWIAALLGFIFAPSGLLYVNRPRVAVAFVALIYLLVFIGIAVVFFGGFPIFVASLTSLSVPSWGLAIASGIYCFRIASKSTISSSRAWYTKWYVLSATPVLTFLPIFLFRIFLYEPFRIPSDSMYPTVPRNSYVIASKFGFGNYSAFGITLLKTNGGRAVHRGDMVIHHLETNPSVRYLRRVIGLPGDHIVYKANRLIVNERPVPIVAEGENGQYSYLTEMLDGKKITVALLQGAAPKDFDVVVPDDCFVLFGDSRDNVRDSRFVGTIARSDIDGLVVKIFRSGEGATK